VLQNTDGHAELTVNSELAGANRKQEQENPMVIRVFTLGALLFALAANGQDPRGTITGVVTDSSQAPVPDVEVRATNPETGVTATAKSNSAGNYNIPFLLPGTYRISADVPGFKHFVRDGI